MCPLPVIGIEEGGNSRSYCKPFLGLKVDYPCEITVVTWEASSSAPAGVNQESVCAVLKSCQVLSVPLIVARIPGHPNIRLHTKVLNAPTIGRRENSRRSPLETHWFEGAVKTLVVIFLCWPSKVSDSLRPICAIPRNGARRK